MNQSYFLLFGGFQSSSSEYVLVFFVTSDCDKYVKIVVRAKRKIAWHFKLASSRDTLTRGRGL